MKKLLLSFAFVAGLASAARAQDGNTAINRCGSFEIYNQMLQNNPAFAKNQNLIESFTQNFIRKGGSSAMLTPTGTPVYIIPVIVHVVYNKTAQNISDAQIQSQIDALNEDYQKLNSDVNKVPSVWTSLVADCQIQFCLASIDPNGNPTTGIRRVHTSKASFNSNDAVKYTSSGGDDAWPAASYLNLWVCKLGQGLLGYAQFPGGSAATDGVVITYTGFGTMGTAQYPYNLGRSATHEIGHWLNLRHIWGDDGTSCSGSDKVGDTPNQAGYHFGCPAFPKVSCSNGPNGDMWMNYMDYTDDRCMYMFSNGQKDRMYATLITGGSRHSVTISGKCGSQAAPTGKNTTIQNILNVVPNPINSGYATVSYKLDRAASVQLMISNVYGSEVTSINTGNQVAGSYQQKLTAFSRLENGIYVIKLIANGEQIATTRFVINK